MVIAVIRFPTFVPRSEATRNRLFPAPGPWPLATAPGHFVRMLLKVPLAPFRPAQSQFHRGAHPFPARRKLRAFIERHDDVRTQPDLRLHRALRTEEMR